MAYKLNRKPHSKDNRVSGEQLRIEGAGRELRMAYKMIEGAKDPRSFELRAAISRAIDAHDKLVEEMYGG
jgi:hypothetical protein